jgi:pimeloyl-ACP methyl ester carboxylesterase
VDKSRQTTVAGDGRRLVFAEWGVLAGDAVFACHGTPGCRLLRHPDEELIRSTGARLITYDRPGYGGSDRHRGLIMADTAGDVAAIADRLGIGRFSVFGVSGGGPHALAVAALLGDRVIRAATVSSVGPFDALGDDYYTGMDPQNVTEVGWALAGEERLAAEYVREDAEDRRRVADDPARMLENFSLAEADRQVLGRADWAQVRRDVAVEQTRNGVWGWVDDSLAQIRPWGFDPAAIGVPVQVWWGTQDVLSPSSHSEWIARTVPGAIVKRNDLGHFGDPDAELVERLTWLTGSRA